MPNHSTPDHPTPDPSSLLDRGEAARWLRRSVTDLDRGVRSGKIPHYRLAGRVLFDPADLKAIVASAYHPGSSED